MIMYDRPSKETIVPLMSPPLIPEREHRPLNPVQVAQVCFQADVALCKVLGLQKASKVQWTHLSQDDKRDFMLHGPDYPEVRADVYVSIKSLLEPFTL